jgi:hypothetical protein
VLEPFDSIICILRPFDSKEVGFDALAEDERPGCDGCRAFCFYFYRSGLREILGQLFGLRVNSRILRHSLQS